MSPEPPPKPNYGSRLILHLIDDVAHESPDRCFCLLSGPDTIKDGFRTVTYGHLANAINRVAWWIGERIERDVVGVETLAYIGPIDLRYTIVTIAAQKAGFKVMGPLRLRN